MITGEDMEALGYKYFTEGRALTLNDYQAKASATAIYPESAKITYAAMGLANEAGEVLGKVKKIIRDGTFSREDILDELGDVLWYAAALARDLNSELSEVAHRNLDKLASRKERGVIGGSGDKR